MARVFPVSHRLQKRSTENCQGAVGAGPVDVPADLGSDTNTDQTDRGSRPLPGPNRPQVRPPEGRLDPSVNFLIRVGGRGNLLDTVAGRPPTCGYIVAARRYPAGVGRKEVQR